MTGRPIPNFEPEPEVVPDHVLDQWAHADAPDDDVVVELRPTGDRPATNLPADFWSARPTLGAIRTTAHARGVAPDALVGAVLARLAALVPPTLRLPPIVGTAAPLNYCAALIGPPGAGKSQAAAVAAEVVPITADDVAAVPMGSGEGIVDAYLGTVTEVDDAGKNVKVRRQVRRGLLVLLDEGQALAELGGRRGATLLPTIRSAWSGAELGQANADPDRRRQVPAGEYALGLLAGFQPEKAVALLDDAEGGTPQRFAWFCSVDPSAPDEAPEPPAPPRWAAPRHRAGEPMLVAPEIAAEVRGRHLARLRGEVVVAELDAHRDLVRLKTAGLLALLDSRTAITAEDWRLAGMVLDTSDRVRATVQWAGADRARQAERRAIERQVVRAAEVDLDADRRALEAMTRAIARHVHRRGCPGGCRRRCMTRATTSKHRAAANPDDAIAEAEARGWIEPAAEGTYRPGREGPA